MEAFTPGKQWEKVEVKRKQRAPNSYACGEDCGNTVLNLKKARLIRRLIKRGWTQKRLGKRFNTSPTNIGKVHRNETWREE